ncbi:hypothetical protein IWZ01DRAFT_22707 [Phyllosticta capitalensis]
MFPFHGRGISIRLSKAGAGRGHITRETREQVELVSLRPLCYTTQSSGGEREWQRGGRGNGEANAFGAPRLSYLASSDCLCLRLRAAFMALLYLVLSVPCCATHFGRGLACPRAASQTLPRCTLPETGAEAHMYLTTRAVCLKHEVPSVRPDLEKRDDRAFPMPIPLFPMIHHQHLHPSSSRPPSLLSVSDLRGGGTAKRGNPLPYVLHPTLALRYRRTPDVYPVTRPPLCSARLYPRIRWCVRSLSERSSDLGCGDRAMRQTGPESKRGW